MISRILHYDVVKSTNDLALQFARDGASEGTVILSNFQTRGRGRFKRRWVSPRDKGLLFSIILRPHLKTSSASILTHLAAKAVMDTLNRRFHIQAKIKKPNDVMVSGRKIAGILTESRGNHQHLDYVVVGIGINVNTKRKDLLPKATSIYLETNQEADKEELLSDILAAFNTLYVGIWGRFWRGQVQKLSSRPEPL